MSTWQNLPRLKEDISVSVNDEWTKQEQIDQDGEKKLQPFEVLLNFQSSELGKGCHSIVSEQTDTDNNGYICTAAGDSGVINLWALPFSYYCSPLPMLIVHAFAPKPPITPSSAMKRESKMVDCYAYFS